MREDYEFYYTQDGSIGLYSYADSDVYHSKYGALTESWEKFILPSNLKSLINKKEEINVLDICYGVGYNTKALMSYVINSNEKYLKRKNIFQRIFYNIKKALIKIIKKFLIFYKNYFKNKLKISLNIDTIDSNNIIDAGNGLLAYNESKDEYNLSIFNIDCLDTKEELIKISPFLKTVLTPQEVYVKLVPKIFDCFDTYWKLKKIFTKTISTITLKNQQHVKDLLDLKFNEDYDPVKKDYKIHKYVNYIIIDSLIDEFEKDCFDKTLKKKFKLRKYRRYFDKSMLKYANFKQDFRYNLLSKLNPFGYLHNIYYEYYSKRYKKMKFNDAKRLFKLSYFVNDARKSVTTLNKEYDLVFLDAFTYSKAPELWTFEFIAEICKRLSQEGILLTYSNSALVRNTFIENNLYVGKIMDEHTGKFIGTVASKEKKLIKYPLTSYELGLCSTKAGITYHDPGLNSTKEEILKRREVEFKSSELMSSTKYMKVRTIKNTDNNEDISDE